MTKARLAAAVALLALGACSVMSVPYAPTPGVSSAQLTVWNSFSNVLSVGIYKEAPRCTHRQTVKPMIAGNERRTLTVPSGDDLAFTLAQDISGRLYCRITVQFKPMPGHRYLAVNQPEGGQCGFALLDITASANPALASRVTYVEREWSTPLDENGPFCTALPQ